MFFAGTPECFSANSSVNGSTDARTSSHPFVRVRRYSSSIIPSAISCRSMALRTAISVPGRTGSQRSAVRARGVSIRDRCRRHAEATFLAHVPRTETYTREFAHDIAFFIRHRRAAIDGYGIFAMFSLNLLPAAHDVVQGLIPAGTLQPTAFPTSSNHGIAQAIRMVDLLVCHNSFRTERAAIMWKIPRFHANNLPIQYAKVHATLHATESAMSWHKRLRHTIRGSPTGGRFPGGLEIVVESAIGLKKIFID